MKHRYHVYTPLWRIRNVPRLVELLRTMGIQWHLLYDEGVKFVHPNEKWIKPMVCPPAPSGWHPSGWKDNWFLDHEEIDDLGRYQHFSDDDWYDPDFFRKIDVVDDDVIIVTMKNGPTPEGPREDLIARPERVRGGRIGAQQIVVAGYIIRYHRYGKHYAGDWDFIESIAKQHPLTFIPEAFVYWNHLT